MPHGLHVLNIHAYSCSSILHSCHFMLLSCIFMPALFFCCHCHVVHIFYHDISCYFMLPGFMKYIHNTLHAISCKCISCSCYFMPYMFMRLHAYRHFIPYSCCFMLFHATQVHANSCIIQYMPFHGGILRVHAPRNGPSLYRLLKTNAVSCHFMPVYIFMLFHATYSMPYTCISIFHAVSCYPDSCKSMHNILHAISWQCSYSFMLPSIMPNHASVYSCFFMPYFHAIFMPYLFMHNALDGRTTAGLYEAVLYNNFFVLLCVLPGRYWNVSTILRVPGPRSGWVGCSLVAHITHTGYLAAPAALTTANLALRPFCTHQFCILIHFFCL